MTKNQEVVVVVAVVVVAVVVVVVVEVSVMLVAVVLVEVLAVSALLIDWETSWFKGVIEIFVAVGVSMTMA